MRRGFSLAESLIACTLVSGIAVALFGVWAQHARAAAHSRDMMVASAFAEQVMEGELSKGYTSEEEPTVGVFTVTHLVDDQPIVTEYRHRIYVQESTDPALPGFKTVRVEVAWEHSGSWHSFSLRTQLSWQG
ncbi:MAG: type II secretion system protein [Candidatus Eremiobacteraeota bacterium]|nr:type II secretion system protein [Candidatus Eremiobacteraeota bacterium]MCW5868474.1 type II secretion system protein [Candidatus Eremiobacteraeota bacterium]